MSGTGIFFLCGGVMDNLLIEKALIFTMMCLILLKRTRTDSNARNKAALLLS